jgi:hypothetical protein
MQNNYLKAYTTFILVLLSSSAMAQFNENFDNQGFINNNGTTASETIGNWIFSMDAADFIATPNGNEFLINLNNSGNPNDRCLLLNLNSLDIREFTLKTANGAEFDIESMVFGNATTSGTATSFEFIGFRNGVAVTSSESVNITSSDTDGDIHYNFVATTAGGSYGNLTFQSAYDNVDEIRITANGSTSVEIDDIIASNPACFPNTFSDFDTATAGNLTGLQTDTASTTIDCWDFTVNSNSGVTITLAGGGGPNPGGAGDHQVNLTRAGGNTNPLNSVTFKANDNNAFRLNSVYVRPAFNPSGNPMNIIVSGLLNGNVVTGAEATYTNVSHNQWLLIDVSSNASFNNVDEIRFTQNTTADWAALSIDEIEISQVTLGTNDYNLTNIKLYPNPALNTIQISNLKESQDYKIYNLLGQSVKQGIIENNQAIDISNLVKGLYLLKLKNNTKPLRFIIE